MRRLLWQWLLCLSLILCGVGEACAEEAASQKHFVPVGAGHLVGGRGIVSQLRAKNHKVDQL